MLPSLPVAMDTHIHIHMYIHATILLEVAGQPPHDLLYHFSFKIWAFNISVVKQLPTNTCTYMYTHVCMSMRLEKSCGGCGVLLINHDSHV